MTFTILGYQIEIEGRWIRPSRNLLCRMFGCRHRVVRTHLGAAFCTRCRRRIHSIGWYWNKMDSLLTPMFFGPSIDHLITKRGFNTNATLKDVIEESRNQ